MRYLGNKDSITDKIKQIILSKTAAGPDTVFFDAFCGTGSVANAFKDTCSVVINDNLNCAATYAYGRIVAAACTFEQLGFDPFSFFNSNDEIVEGYFFRTYSPGGSSRMYLSEHNAGRVDYFRQIIEEWYGQERITENEYRYLLACLIESVSFVSNTAGVYGAFLKKWDERALKNIQFLDISDGIEAAHQIEVHTEKLEHIIGDIDCDILYLDPPYTQNQYGTQYHLLETLIRDDRPETISRVTGSRSTREMRSDWSKIYKVHILLDQIIAETSARYVFLSYNNDGDMSREYIEAVMKRYGVEESFECITIPYKKYENWKSRNKNIHYEYLFCMEKKPAGEVVYESPLNYIGSKAKVVPYIRANLLQTSGFVDVFGGGFNVGINADCDTIWYNDINFMVKDLIESFRRCDTYEYITFVKKFIENHHLEKGNKEAYLAAREYYNSLPEQKKDIRMLFAITLYSYQQQMRFNSSYGFNNTAGIRWFNDYILAKLISFSRVIKNRNVSFISTDYIALRDHIPMDENTFLYLDPPYKLTTGSYNDGKRGFKGWDDKLEQELFDFIDEMTDLHVPCMLSYVLEHKGVVNTALENWINRNEYTCIPLGDILGISGQPRKEILILNYSLTEGCQGRRNHMAIPRFVIKKNMNKSSVTGKSMQDILTDAVLREVCLRITGREEYTVDFVDNDYEDDCLSKSYNKGRLAVLKYDNKNAFVSFSEETAEGRNSAVQSVGTAFNIYYQSKAEQKELYYYFLGTGTKFQTDYLLNAYRQMQTIGFRFLNTEVLDSPIVSYGSVEDLISSRKITAKKNKSNKASYVTKDRSKEIEIYGKTYGANKYDAAMLGFTASVLAKLHGQHVTLYEILEGNLEHMPEACARTLELMENVEIIPTDLEFDRTQFTANNSLRSPRYISNLLDRVGIKRCALCNCEVPEIIQGAHVWPVSMIKKQPLTFEEQLAHAISGHNGLWLCENHHKLFDENIIRFDNTGKLDLSQADKAARAFILKITDVDRIPEVYHSPGFFEYLALRNQSIDS